MTAEPPGSARLRGVSRVPALELRSTLLLLGMLVGVASMSWGLDRRSEALPPGIAAQVGDRGIPESEVEATLASLRGAGFSQISRDTVLDRLIDEELLLQQALRLDLPHKDRRLRAGLVRDVIDANNAAVSSAPPSDAELRAHFDRNPKRFASAAQLELELAWFRGPSAESEATLAHELWQTGQDPHGNAEVVLPLPSGLVPVTTWREYLGRSTADRLAELPEGAISDAFRWDDAWGVAKIKRRTSASPPAFSEVKGLVLADYRRRQAEERLRELLRSLRGAGRVRRRGGSRP